MTDKKEDEDEMKLPESSKAAKIYRGALQAIGGAIPLLVASFLQLLGHGQRTNKKRLTDFLNTGLECYKTNLKKKRTQ